ncbi:hypothetical protein ABH922_001868 [Rhodococcus sp. 27YEA15]|uniref:LiaF domain-containing protein n=1 Tax=Rhodococcus sp. 27YEA15 TaxID=3156259 RepID=UPI003C7A4131
MTAADDGNDIDGLRAAAQAGLEAAVGEGRLTLEEYSDKVAEVWSPSVDAVQLAQIVPFGAGSPATVPPPQSTIVGVFGDVKRSGRWSLAVKTRAWLLFGDFTVDLRSATVDATTSTITVVSIFGDTSLVVPEGVCVELDGFDLFGDREFDGGRTDPGPGAPVIRIASYSLFGDVRVRTRWSGASTPSLDMCRRHRAWTCVVDTGPGHVSSTRCRYRCRHRRVIEEPTIDTWRSSSPPWRRW